MGKSLTKLFGNQELRVLMLGLDSAGKTTILYKLKLGQSVATIPTVGFNVENVIIGKVKFNVWDVGGQDKIRPLWRQYFDGAQALVFVIDSCDRDRIDEARQEFLRIIAHHEMSNVNILILANKSDCKNAMDVNEITDKMNLERLRNRTWYVQKTSGITGDGLVDGFSWLTDKKK